MKKKILILGALSLLICLLAGCAPARASMISDEPDPDRSDAPHRMVESIDVTIHPADSSFDRHYQSQELLTTTLKHLRKLETSQAPEQDPSLDDGQTYYTVTAIYSSGEQQSYILLSYRFLKVGDEPWCEVNFDNAMGFTRFIREHSSETGNPGTERTLPRKPSMPGSVHLT